MPIKILHFADVHIGTENYGRLDTLTGLHSRLQDFVESLRFACETAIAEKVDLAVFAGDAYKTCDPSPTHQREFAAQIRTLVNADIPVVMVVGNHDIPVAFGRASSVDIFGTLDISGVYVLTKPRSLKIRTKSGPVQVAGLPWPARSQLLTKSEYKDLSEEEVVQKIVDICTGIIANFAEELDPRIPSLLVAHLSANEAVLSGSERSAMIGRDPSFMTSVLANPAFDYVALGHIHKFQDLNPLGKPHVVYSGSIERIDFGEEGEEKGFCLIAMADEGELPPTPESKGESFSLFSEADERDDSEVDVPPVQSGEEGTRRETSYRFIRTPARPFVTIEAIVEEDRDPTEALLEEIAKHDLTDAVVRVVYTLLAPENGALDLKRVHEALMDAFLIAGIVPRAQPQERLRRADVSEDLGLSDALDRYIENNPDLESLKEDLKTYAITLERELEGEEHA